MNRLHRFLSLLIVSALLCGQVILVSAQEQPEEKEGKPAVKKPLKEQIFVGQGYDITDQYAHRKSAREQIFNVGADDQGKPVIVAGEQTFEIEVLDDRGSKLDEFFGESLSEYQKDFSNRLDISGNYKIFSGHLKTNFSIDTKGANNKEFATVMHVVTLRSYKLPFEIDPSMIRPEAQKAIDTADPRTLFKRFGTHYIWQASVGGRVDFNFTKNKSSSEKDFNMRVEARAAVEGKIASVSVENETKYKDFEKKLDENGSYKIVTHGGSLDVGATMRQDRTALASWSNSVENNPTLCSFDNQSLRPIWELASTDERKAEIEAAFAKYLEEGGIKISAVTIEIQRADVQRVVSNWYATSTDQDLGNNRVGFYAPAASDGYYVVGHIADNNNDTRPGADLASLDSILVRELGEPGKLLAKPVRFTQIYRDAGTRAKDNWSLWQAVCPVNFVSVGFFARREYGDPNSSMPDDPFANVRCVHKSLVEPAAVPDINSFFFTGEHQRGFNLLLFHIKPEEGSDAIDGNFFYPFSPAQYGNPLPGNLQLWVLKNPNPGSAAEEPDNDDK
jgi:hypothetical protein